MTNEERARYIWEKLRPIFEMANVNGKSIRIEKCAGYDPPVVTSNSRWLKRKAEKVLEALLEDECTINFMDAVSRLAKADGFERTHTRGDVEVDVLVDWGEKIEIST